MTNRLLEWKAGQFEIWQDTDGKFYAVDALRGSELHISKEFALDAMSSGDDHFIDCLCLLTFH